MNKILACFLLLLINFALQAQRPGSRPRSGGFDTSNAPQGGDNNIPYDVVDTFGVYYFYAEQPNLLRKLEDTTLNQFDIYRPTNQRPVQYADLGTIGTAHRPLWFEMPFRRGFDVGYHQYDLYYTQPNQMRFNVLEKPYSRVFYSRGRTQSDGFFQGKFSRNFAKGLSFTLEGQTIRERGQDNHYPNQRLEVESAGTGFWWNAPNERYDAFLYFTSNTSEQEENGGIVEEPLRQNGLPFDLSIVNPQTATVALPSSTTTRHANKTVGYLHYFSLMGSDSTKTNKRTFNISHKAEFQHHNYKYTDSEQRLEPRADYYGQFYTDPRGLRNFIRWRVLENQFQVSTFRLAQVEQSAEQKERDRLEVGLSHQIHFLRQDQRDSTINNLFLMGKLDFTIKEAFQLHTYAHLGILANAGDYRIGGDFQLDVGKIGKLDVAAASQASEPFLIQQEFYVSQRPIWQQDLQKVIHSQIQATYTLPILNLSLTGGYHLVNNFIYYDTTATPVQADNALNVLQLNVQQRLRLWKLHFYNQVAFQATSQDFFRTPNWITHHRFYVEASLFRKALPFQLGMELRMNDPYFADYYQPLLGQFQLQDQRAINFYPALDAFLNLKIKTARIFVKAENLSDLLTGDDFYYQISTYAQPPLFIRFGFDWRFVN